MFHQRSCSEASFDETYNADGASVILRQYPKDLSLPKPSHCTCAGWSRDASQLTVQGGIESA